MIIRNEVHFEGRKNVVTLVEKTSGYSGGNCKLRGKKWRARRV